MTSASIDAPHAPSIDVSLPTAQIPAEPQCSAKHKDEWEVSYIDTRINDVYYPLNNNVDWLSTKIELLQQDLDTIRKKDQQPATLIDVCNITSLDAKVSAMNERLRTYEDMHDRFISPAKSSSIDRLQGPWIDGKNPVELLPYTAAEVDEITSKIYTAIDTMEERLDKRCDDIYFPFDNRISGLDSHQDLDTIRKKDQQPATSIDVCNITSLDAKVSAMNERLRTYEDMHDRFISSANSSSIDRLQGPWIDGKNHEELLPYTAAEVDKITSKIYTAIDTMEERLDKRCDDIYFPFDNRINGLDSHAEWLQKEVKAIQRQLAAQHQISASIDRKRAKSLDGKSLRSTDEHIIASIDAESTPTGEQLIHKTIESMRKELTELSAYAYDNIGWHHVSIENVQDRLQNISNVLEKMDDK
ncbi:hypothetical protein DY000_02020243 [Brassica cretica]|uniref:Uncharacterized protein n=1 Tax=Brassica cretica TaxID=69181 RepID=A0ABQ7E1B1_BRACR|nr:hypothetical protein DY000_02020243 [Brassica cretica]